MNLSQLALEKPIVFFDLETTGLNVVTDRIVQIAALRYEPGNEIPQRYQQLVNPGMPIPAQSSEIHGIYDADVADAHHFKDIVKDIYNFFDGADLGGYNMARFDLPVLMEEFERCKIRFRADNRRLVDVQEVFYRLEPRTLAGAVRFYCNEEMENAHDAMADIEATVKVLEGQLKRYVPHGQLESSVEALHTLSQRPGQLDATNRLRRDEEGEIVFNFGKFQGQRAREVFKKEPSYYHWLQNKDFSVQVKEFTQELWESMK